MPLTEIQPTNAEPAEPPKATKGKGKTVEETYKKLTHLEHVMQRPDTYVGSIETHTEQMWAMDAEEGRMKPRKLSFVPGLYKIFDEILVNAADNKQRDASMTAIKIDIDREAGRISVWNDGKGIPVQMHQTEKMYVPELIFGAPRPRALCLLRPCARRGRRGHPRDARAAVRDPMTRTPRGRPPADGQQLRRQPEEDYGRPQRLRRQAGQHLLERVCRRDGRLGERQALQADVQE